MWQIEGKKSKQQDISTACHYLQGNFRENIEDLQTHTKSTQLANKQKEEEHLRVKEGERA